jgi:hypothetical protein
MLATKNIAALTNYIPKQLMNFTHHLWLAFHENHFNWLPKTKIHAQDTDQHVITMLSRNFIQN